MNPLNLSMDRYTKPTTDAPHELSEATNLIEQAGLFSETYDRGYWLKLLKAANFDHPAYEIRKLLKTMRDRANWLKAQHGKLLNRGGWLTNRLKELRSTPAQGAAPAQPRSENPNLVVKSNQKHHIGGEKA